MDTLDRRGFLGGVGAAGLWAAFPAIARARAIPADTRSGTIRDIDHVVILMQENRSFDHYFGTLRGVRGFADPHPAPAPPWPDGAARTVLTQANTMHPGPERIAPFPLNTRQSFAHMRVRGTPHSWPNAQAAWDNGRMGRWPDWKELHAMGYFERADIPFQYALADAFTICDAYHCSIQSSTNPNRIFLWSGTNDPGGRRGGPALGNSHDNLPEHGGWAEPYRWRTYPERLQAAGIDWAIYQDMADNFTDNPLVGFAAFRDSLAGRPGSDPELARRGLTTRTLDTLRDDAENGRLPAVSYIIATAEGSEHPDPSSPAQGAAYTARVLDALTADPRVWARTALFVLFDENDGFFDHVPPPAPPSRDPAAPGGFAGHSQVPTEGEYHLVRCEADAEYERADFMGRPYGLGARVPAYVVSPFSRGGHVSSEVLDHTSVNRFLERRFGVRDSNISPWRRAVCGDFTNAFDFAHPNRAPFPDLPDPRPAARRAAALPGHATPPIPAEQRAPAQEPGARPQCPRLYDPAVEWAPAQGHRALHLTLRNRGDRAVVLHVYDRLAPAALPHRYTVAPGGEIAARWRSAGARGYDLQIMGPEGFHRRIRMAGPDAERRIAFAAHGGAVRLRTDRAGLYVRDAAGGRRPLPDGAAIAIPVDPDGRYDFALDTGDDAGDDARTLYQFAGRIAPGGPARRV